MMYFPEGMELPYQWDQGKPWLLAVCHVMDGQKTEGKLHPHEGGGNRGHNTQHCT